MGEPESLSVEEGLSSHIRRHSYDRLLMLSDGIFAIATTLAALEIRPPEHLPSIEALVQALTRPIAVYLLSFLITAVYWISHRNLFARLRAVDAPLTVLTLAMLCMIALVPAALRGVLPGEGEGGLRFYALILFMCGLFNCAMWFYAASKPRLMIADLSANERWSQAAFTVAAPLLFAVMLALPGDMMVKVVAPTAAAMVAIRRFVLPRLTAKFAAR